MDLFLHPTYFPDRARFAVRGHNHSIGDICDHYQVQS